MDPGTSTQYFWTTKAQGKPADAADGNEFLCSSTNETATMTKEKPKRKRQRSRCSSLAERNIVGCRISHNWKEEDGSITHWRGTILNQIATNPTIYMVKYDEIGCVYAIELHQDERVLSLKVISGIVKPSPVPDPDIADTIIGKVVDHVFENNDGSKNLWRGMVLAKAPLLDRFFYITYTNDPILYMYELLDDYKEGNLRILPVNNDIPPLDVGLKFVNGLIGKEVEYANEDGSKRTGKFIGKIEALPSVYLIKFDDDFHIYVYDFVENV